MLSMAKEIERKFLVKNSSYKSETEGVLYRQGYLSRDINSVVRVRLISNKAFMTVKGAVVGIERPEFEYEIPFSDGEFMLENLCKKPVIKKIRYKVDFEGFTWEVDEFLGQNTGLVIAELELQSAQQQFPMPEWVGEEVTGDPRYYNSNLCG